MAKARIQLITPESRITFPNLFKARKNDLRKDREVFEYSAVFLMDKSQKEEISNLVKAYQKIVKEEWGDKVPKFVKNPFKDGDADDVEREEYKNCVYFTAKNESQPGCIDANTSQPIMTEGVIYAGCYVRGDISLQAFEIKNEKGSLINAGVTIYLNNVLKIKEGERLDGRRSAKQAFSEFLGSGSSPSSASSDEDLVSMLG